MTTQGASNRRRGHQAERDLVAWLRTHGWPHAERAVRTGYRTADRTSPDHGDVDGTPGLAWQSKNVAREDIPAWLAETEAQRAAARASFGILVQRRPGKSDPGRWWAWVPIATLWGILLPPPGHLSAPVRLELADLVPVLHRLGFGDAAEDVGS